jgi:hypothetical protein
VIIRLVQRFHVERREATHCKVHDCKRWTYDSKDFCRKHVEEMPYVKEILARLCPCTLAAVQKAWRERNGKQEPNNQVPCAGCEKTFRRRAFVPRQKYCDSDCRKSNRKRTKREIWRAKARSARETAKR